MGTSIFGIQRIYSVKTDCSTRITALASAPDSISLYGTVYINTGHMESTKEFTKIRETQQSTKFSPRIHSIGFSRKRGEIDSNNKE